MQDDSTRRQFLGLAGSAAVLGAVPIVTLRPAEATPAMLASAIRNVVGEAVVRTGRVKLEVPPLVENGNTVPMTVSVQNPMTTEDHVKSIHVFNEKNPQPKLAFGPAAAGAGEAGREIALEFLFRKRSVVAEDAGALAVDKCRPPASGIAGRSGQRHRNGRRPRPRPGARILDGEFVNERARIGAGEALDQMHVRARARKGRLAPEGPGLDHQRVPLPVAARFAFPLRNVLERAAVERDAQASRATSYDVA